MISHESNAQQINLSGKIYDNVINQPIKNAVVMILSDKDSVLKAFARTKEDGSFTLQSNVSGKVILMISHPLYAEYIDDIKITNANIKFKNIGLTNKSKLLSEFIIKTGGSIKIKGDTTIYTADSFNVSANANVEELLKKLPGIQVDKDGQIKAMGQKVEKVLVDGEEFFGDDPGMAVKNLRADAVKEVQVFDKKSEQAEFTGIDDGNTKKTINLKLKADKRKGYFGKINLAGGVAKDISNRFNNNFLFGSFKGSRKISAFLLNGNISQDGLSWQDSQKYGTSDNSNFEMWDEDGIFSFSMGGNSSEEEISINTENGFLRNVNSGLQYSNKWNDNKHNINFSPKYNEQSYTNETNSRKITQINDSNLIENSKKTLDLSRYNLRNSFTYDFKIDSANSLKMTLNYNYYHSESDEKTFSTTKGNSDNLINSSNKDNKITADKNANAINLVFKHKFKKDRRTLSLNSDWNAFDGNSKTNLVSQNEIINDTILLDQITLSNKRSNKLSAKLNYTEPLLKKWSLELAYQLSKNISINNQQTFENTIQNKLIDSLTNDFNQEITIQTPSAKFNYNFKKIKFNFGSGFGFTQFHLLNKTIDTNYNRIYTNLLPNATFVYTYKGNHSLRVKYNGYNTQPTINQLQPLKQNNDFFNQYEGNPSLRPSFTNNINVTHNGYNFLKEAWNYQSFNLNLIQDAITNNYILDPSTGKSIIKPINTTGNVNANLWAGLGTKIKKIKLDVELNVNFNFDKRANIINNFKSFSNDISSGLGVVFRKSKSNKYDFTVNNNFDIIYNTNAQSKTTNTFTNNLLSFDGKIYYKKVWSLKSQYSFFARGNIMNQTNNLNAHILNAQIEKTFKNNEFTLSFKINDVLNQNLGIDRSYNGNIFTEDNNQRLKRYFMVGFAWDFKNKK
jgi:hypothetical protein